MEPAEIEVLETLRRPPDVEDLLERLTDGPVALFVKRRADGLWTVHLMTNNPVTRPARAPKAQSTDLWCALAMLAGVA